MTGRRVLRLLRISIVFNRRHTDSPTDGVWLSTLGKGVSTNSRHGMSAVLANLADSLELDILQCRRLGLGCQRR